MAEEDRLSEHALRSSAGRMLTRHLTQVGQELTESNGFDDTGSPRQITKIEALARLMWKLAFGYSEETRKLDTKTGKVMLLKKYITPDKSMIELIYNRMEGKVASQEDDGQKKSPLSSRIKDQVNRRIKNLANSSEDSTG